MPYLELFAALTSPEERRAYQDALEDMLSSADSEQRHRAVTICLGFVVFQSAIRK